MEYNDGLIQVPQKDALKQTKTDQTLLKRCRFQPKCQVPAAMFTSKSFSAAGELSDFLPFPLALPTEFLRPTSSWSLAPVGGATPAGRAAPAGRLSGGEASAARSRESQVSA